ncbi:MAG: hypothetical protein FWE56_04975 [Candidatus Bathyarchaeota archaeon]|nr:hypothetical protein [Candidatus Termiticorpusculum sp.]MCL2868951.1 hypothetical protein [Candidatus Termiticorpusculum sp.]
MLDSDWKYTETVQKRVRTIKVDFENRRVDVFDLELGVSLNFNADQAIDLGKVKRAKIYVATVKIYKAEFTEHLERQMIESALGNSERLKQVQAFKESGAKPTRFDLIKLEH